MKDERKTKAELIEELVVLRQRLEAQQNADQVAKRVDFRELQNKIPDGVAITLGPDIVYTNDVFAQMCGYSTDELIGLSGMQLLHSNDRKRATARVRDLINGATPYPSEYFMLRKDGSSFDAEVFSAKVAWRDAVGLISTVRDITVRKQAEEALRQSEQRFKEITETVSEVFWVFSADMSRLEYISPAYESVWGLSCASLYENPRSYLDVIHPDDREHAIFKLTLFRSRVPIANKLRIVRPDGSLRWIYTRGFPVMDQITGEVQRNIGTSIDITDLKNAENELRGSYAYLDSILDNLPVGVVVFEGPDFRINRFNKDIAEMTGLCAENLIGRPFLEVLPEAAQQHLPNLEKILAGDQTFQAKELRLHLPHPTSEPRWYFASAFLMSGPTGTSRAVGIIIFDVTQRKRLEQEVLMICERERQRIGRDLHDDLGQQLTGIGFLVDGLHQRLEEQGLWVEAERTDTISKLIKKTITTVRELARGLYPFDMKPSRLKSALQNLAIHSENLYGVPCEVSFAQRLSIDDASVVTALYHIAQESVTNAVRHGQASRIHVSLQKEADHAVLTIEDNGCGLPNDFRQSEGIGLRIMKYRASMIYGSIEVRNARSGGAVVTCRVQLSSAGQLTS